MLTNFVPVKRYRRKCRKIERQKAMALPIRRIMSTEEKDTVYGRSNYVPKKEQRAMGKETRE